VYRSTQGGVPREHPCGPLWQANVTAIEAAHRARRVVDEAIAPAIREAGNVVVATPLFKRAHQLTKCDVALAPHNEVDHARLLARVGLWRQARIVAAHHHLDCRPQLTYEVDELYGRPALKSHPRQPHHVGCQLAHEPFDGLAHAVLHENQIGDCDAVVG